MIIQCVSCSKKFVVPDAAITPSGRVVQCGTCGNKWTQYPETIQTTTKQPLPKKTSAAKKRTQKRKVKETTPKFTNEYLEKKYGIEIKKDDQPQQKAKVTQNSKISTGLGFYGYSVFLIVFILTLFGILGLLREDLIYNYPATAIYIDNIYEIVENIYLLITNLF